MRIFLNGTSTNLSTEWLDLMAMARIMKSRLSDGWKEVIQQLRGSEVEIRKFSRIGDAFFSEIVSIAGHPFE